MRALIIDEQVKALIAKQLEVARDQGVMPIETASAMDANVDEQGVIDHEAVLRADAIGEKLNRPKPIGVTIPDGFDVAVSFEQQPRGVCIHISISVDTPGKLPSVAAVAEIVALYGIRLAGVLALWKEEYEPGCYAVNVVDLDPKSHPRH